MDTLLKCSNTIFYIILYYNISSHVLFCSQNQTDLRVSSERSVDPVLLLNKQRYNICFSRIL